VARLVDAQGPEDQEVQLRIRRGFLVARIELFLLVLWSRMLRFCPPEIGVLVAKQKHDSGRKKMDQRRSKEKREPGGRRGERAALGKGGSSGKR
jgi:hypothetical protein